MAFLIEVEQQQQNPQNVCNHKIWKSLYKLKKENKFRGITLTDFKLCYKAVIIKTFEFGKKTRYRPMEQNWKLRNKPTRI